jgi:hypothetical protein
MKPIDLWDLYGHRCRIQRDPAALHEKGGRKDPWLYIIPSRKGHIFPHSDTKLALWWESAKYLDRICPHLELYQDGEDEKVYLFEPQHFDQVAKMVKPRKRRTGRKLTEDEKQAAALRLKPHRFLRKCQTTQR